MKEELIKGNLKVIEVRKGHAYKGLRQRKNGVFYTTNIFNAKSLDDAMEYMQYLEERRA